MPAIELEKACSESCPDQVSLKTRAAMPFQTSSQNSYIDLISSHIFSFMYREWFEYSLQIIARNAVRVACR